MGKSAKPQPTSSNQIFLSHASPDKDAAEALATWLRQVFPIRVFVSTIPPGANWSELIEQSLQSCKVGIVLLTENSLNRAWVNFEAGYLCALRKLIPVRCGRAQGQQLPPTMQHVQICDWDNATHRTRLLKSIGELLGVREEPYSHPVLTITEPPATAPEGELFANREPARGAMKRLIDTALKTRTTLRVAGMANTEFFDATVSDVSAHLRAALEKGLTANFIFLDPDSPTAVRRSILEFKRLGTIKKIQECLGTATNISAALTRSNGGGRLRIRTVQEVSSFLCLSGDEAICQPYLWPETGRLSPTWCGRGEVASRLGEHFDSLWGPRYVLFDVGNVLIPFDHRRVSTGLAALAGENSGDQLRDRIHTFLFDPQRDQPAWNTRLDRGQASLADLLRAFTSTFATVVPLAGFQELWCSIFDKPQQPTLEWVQAIAAHEDVRVAICSNTNAEHWSFLVNTFPVLEAHPSYLSYKLNRTKVDPELFLEVAQQTGRPLEDHLLIDDLECNRDAARRAGVRVLEWSGDLRLQTITDHLKKIHWM